MTNVTADRHAGANALEGLDQDKTGEEAEAVEKEAEEGDGLADDGWCTQGPQISRAEEAAAVRGFHHDFHLFLSCSCAIISVKNFV